MKFTLYDARQALTTDEFHYYTTWTSPGIQPISVDTYLKLQKLHAKVLDYVKKKDGTDAPVSL